MNRLSPNVKFVCIVAVTILSGFGAFAIAQLSPTEPSALSEDLYHCFVGVFSFGCGALIGMIASIK